MSRYTFSRKFRWVVCGLMVGTVWAQSGGWAGAPWRLPADASAASLAGINLFPAAATEAYAFNPAVLAAHRELRLTVGSGFLSLGRFLYAGHIQAALPPTAFLGAGFLAAGTGGLTTRDNRGYPLGSMNDQEQVIVLAFANAFAPGVSAGLGLHLVRRTLLSRPAELNLSATGAGLDLGFYLQRRRFQFSLAGRNLNTAYHWRTDSYFEKGSSYSEPFPATVAAGMAVTGHGGSLFFQGEYSQMQNYNWRLGGTLAPLPGIDFRGGVARVNGQWLWSGGFGLARQYHGFRGELYLGVQTGVPAEGLRQYVTLAVRRK